MAAGSPLLDVRNLSQSFALRRSAFRSAKLQVHAVRDVDLTLEVGETLGLVGESGCGKTTLGRCIARLSDPTAGEIRFHGEDILKYDRRKLRQLRRRIQTVFQDPYSSLNPRKKVGKLIREPLEVFNLLDAPARQRKALELMEIVGLRLDHADRYPHEFSGGQRQRIAIARALALEPEFLILDEPTSALDVSVQAQIVNLLMRLQREFRLSYLFISHDLNLVQHVSDRVAVMYLGRIVETGPSQAVLNTPRHPYTRALIASVPEMTPGGGISIVSGELPSPLRPPSGCAFHPRCPARREICSRERPVLAPDSTDTSVACFFPQDAGRPDS